MEAVEILDRLMAEALKKNASDIHIEPKADRLLIRIRVDGMLVEHETLEKVSHPPLISRAKIMAGMDITEKRLPQDGHIKTKVGDRDIDVRVSVVPTIYGEKAVLRFLNTEAAVEHAETFGMDEETYRSVLDILNYSSGILYITGPTGSGKTTTLYMILEHLAARPINIMTIEDPVEKNIDGVNQIQVNLQAGLTFEKGLRAILRQDPDVIMIGETRDKQTAQISVRAAITGHFVLSTLHTRDAVGVIARLADMGIEPYLVADSLCGVIAQRLVKKICPHCAVERPATEEERELFGSEITTVRYGAGCPDCNHTGYRGRVAVHELIVIDKAIRRMIAERESVDMISEYIAKTQKIRPIKTRLLALVREGVTSVEEYLRITYGEEQ